MSNKVYRANWVFFFPSKIELRPELIPLDSLIYYQLLLALPLNSHFRQCVLLLNIETLNS